MSYTYDLIVIGGGAAGLTASGIGANFGAKTLMIERARLGGDCTWYGCIPSKTLLKSAKVAHHIRTASRYGLTDQPVELDFAKVMAHLHQVRNDVYEEADRPEIYQDMGVEVRFGEARFLDAHTVALESESGTDILTSRYFIIAAGARVFIPPITGMDTVPYLTNETLFEIDRLPQRLLIIGAGPIGTEMAQAFARFGSEVTVVDQSDHILSKDDPELTQILQGALEQEGVHYRLGARVKQIAQRTGEIAVEVEQDGEHEVCTTDALLLATGRKPNTDALNLEAAGVTYTNQGITVDDRCRTNQRHIYAVGDVTGRYQFTHMSEHMAKVAATNLLLKVPMKIDTRHVPWVTYTDPEIGHVGATQADLDAKDISYDVYRFPYTKVDRAVAENESTGWIKVYAKSWNGKILGVDVLGVSAGEVISEYALAMRNGLTLRNIADTIHPYPTYGLGARRAADQWYARKQSTTLVRFLQFLFGYRGPVIEPDPNRIV